MAQYTTPTMDSIHRLSAEQQTLWAKAGGSEKLTEAERGRLADIRARLESLWHRRREEKAGAKTGLLDSRVARSPSPARQDRRRGRAERRTATLYR